MLPPACPDARTTPPDKRHANRVPARAAHPARTPMRRRATLRRRATSSPHAGRFQRQALRAPREVELDVGQLGRARRWHLRAHAEQARAYASLQRAQVLPLEAISGKRGGLPLAERLVQQAFAVVLVVA